VKRAIFTGVVWAIVTLGWAAFWITVARADDTQARLDWIHKNAAHCCDHKDCGPARLTMTFTGWKAEGADNVVPFASVIRWPFSGPWACIIDRHMRCAFADGGG
jgi:hypothetical protein